MHRGCNSSQPETFLQCQNTPFPLTLRSTKYYTIYRAGERPFVGNASVNFRFLTIAHFLFVRAFRAGATELRKAVESRTRLLLSRALDSASIRYCRINDYPPFSPRKNSGTRTVSPCLLEGGTPGAWEGLRARRFVAVGSTAHENL